MSNIILVVEDEPRNMKLVRDFLNVSGYVTVEAINGQEALEMTQKEKPGLILMDIQMPILNGIEATKKLKQDELLRHIPIVALTAFAMKGDREKIIAAGADDYLAKPLDLAKLIDTVARYVSKEKQPGKAVLHFV